MRSEQEEARRVCRICPELADCRAWTLAQPAYRMDASMVAAMTPAERFAERQKPWLAKLEPVRPGPVARHPSLTRYPGPKPPPFARRGADGHGHRRVRGIPQPVRLSTRHLRGVAPTADARPHATARPAPIPPPARHRKPCGPKAGKEHSGLIIRRSWVRAPPPHVIQLELGFGKSGWQESVVRFASSSQAWMATRDGGRRLLWRRPRRRRCRPPRCPSQR
jgi:hypothetical protein